MSGKGTGSYATTGFSRVLRQGLHAIQSRAAIADEVAILHARLKRDEARISARLGRPVRDLDILEIGPGQHCERSRYFGEHNRVMAVDMDRIPRSGKFADYLGMLRKNGVGRLMKTAGRKVLFVDRRRRHAWINALGTSHLPDPMLINGDVCRDPLPASSFDAVLTWSVFEHLSSPERAIENIVQALRPGGVFYVGIHLYTSNTGHHDIRAFTGGAWDLPPWGHLRPTTKHLIQPSAYLNECRLPQWRATFDAKAPGCQEFLQDYDAETSRKRLTPDLRKELSQYSDDELLSVEAFYLWKKPLALD